MKKQTLFVFAVFLSLAIMPFVSAAWVSSLDEGLVHYYTLNETSGTVALDTMVGTSQSLEASNKSITPRWSTGKVGGGINVSRFSFLNVTNLTHMPLNNWSFSMWVFENDTAGGDQGLMDSGGNNRLVKQIDGGYWWTLGGRTKTANALYVPDEWKFIVGTINESGHYLWINGTMDISLEFSSDKAHDSWANFSIGDSFEYNMTGIIDEVGLWNRTLTPTEINELWNGGLGTSYGGIVTEPTITITLNSPANDTSHSSTEINFISNYSMSSGNYYNFTNVTYWTWFTNGTVFNNTENLTISGTSNSTTQKIENFTLENYKWNTYVCWKNSTFANCSFANSNYTFDVATSLISISYTNFTYETEREIFSAEFEMLEGSEISVVQLVYNGTNYTISNVTVSGTGLNVSTEIDVPLIVKPFGVNETKTFFFRFTYEGDVVQETSTYQQNVSYINLQLCNGTYNTTTINFTYYDELTGGELNATQNKTDMEVNFNYWLGTGSVYKNYSYQNLTNNLSSQYRFCLYPNETFYNDMDMQYGAEDYSPREYYFRNATLTNVSRELPLYLLDENNYVKFFMTTLEGMTEFFGGIITISKYFTGEGSYKTISIRETDDGGKFVEYFELDQKYRFSISRDGVSYGNIIKTAICEEAPCEITVQIEEAITNLWEGYYDSFASNVVYNLSYNDNTKIVTYDFVDLTGLAQYFRLLVTKTSYNQTSGVICNKTLYSTSGSLTCNVTGYSGDFVAKGFVSRSPELFVDAINFLIQTIKDVLGATGMLVALLLILTIALVGFWNPVVGVVLTGFAILMMKILGFVAFSYTTVVLIFIMVIILAVKMKT